MGRLYGLALLVFAALAPAAFAEDGPDCRNAMAQQDMNICAGHDFEAADRQLNAAYRKLVAALQANEKALLVTAQRKWIAFRDKECAYQASANEGGSIYPMMVSGCMTRLTKDRTAEINAHIKQRSGM